MGTEIELLVVGNSLLRKEEQDQLSIKDYREKYELD
jgi:carbamoyltransferase